MSRVVVTDDLVSRLNAELDRREEIAKACERVYPSPWDVSDRGWMAKVTADEPHFRIVAKLHQEHVKRGEVEWLSDALDHVAANDPAFVLRWLSGVRELVEWHGGRHVCEDQLVFRLDEPKWDEDDPDRKPCEVLKIVASMLGVEP